MVFTGNFSDVDIERLFCFYLSVFRAWGRILFVVLVVFFPPVGSDVPGRRGCMSFPVCPLWASLWLCGGFLRRGCTMYRAME